MPLVGPGTAPRTSTRLCSAITRAIARFLAVTRRPPMRPPHPHALHDPGRIRGRADGARCPFPVVLPVRAIIDAPEAVASHYALKALALGPGGDIHDVSRTEEILDAQFISHFHGRLLPAELHENALGRRRRRREVALHGLGSAPHLSFSVAELHGIIAVLAIRALDLHHDVGTHLQHRAGHVATPAVENGRHPDLSADHSAHGAVCFRP